MPDYSLIKKLREREVFIYCCYYSIAAITLSHNSHKKSSGRERSLFIVAICLVSIDVILCPNTHTYVRLHRGRARAAPGIC